MERDEQTTQHLSVLLAEVVEFLRGSERESKIFLDCTLGGGGHSAALLEICPEAILVGLDRDENAIRRAEKHLGNLKSRAVFLHMNFGEIIERQTEILTALKSVVPHCSKLAFDGIVADLGLSSDQLDDPQRGFSFSVDGPLDMRMDQCQGITAADILNTYSFAQMRSMFVRGGLRQGAEVLANAVIKNRPFQTTREFSQLCQTTLRVLNLKKRERSGSVAHPATVPFQALRIEVNGELLALSTFMTEVPALLSSGGRMAVISFHSSEDKVVAQAFRRLERGDELPRFVPVRGEQQVGLGKLLTKKAVLPTALEVERNPRARSARMRVFERHE